MGDKGINNKGIIDGKERTVYTYQVMYKSGVVSFISACSMVPDYNHMRFYDARTNIVACIDSRLVDSAIALEAMPEVKKADTDLYVVVIKR